jgi:hypothetical protein
MIYVRSNIQTDPKDNNNTDELNYDDVDGSCANGSE